MAVYIAKTYLAEAQDESTFYTAFLLFIGLAVLGVMFYFFIRPWAVTIGIKGVVHSIAAAAVAFIGMIIFNPFHLTNLTHTYVISISKHAEQWRSVNEWHSAWEWTNPVGTAYPFLVMFIIAIAAFAIWFFNWLFKPEMKPSRQKVETAGAEFEWPKMDIAMIIIAALSVYMAITVPTFHTDCGDCGLPGHRAIHRSDHSHDSGKDRQSGANPPYSSGDADVFAEDGHNVLL